MNKKYLIRGLLLGIVFGILVVLAHENISEFFNFFGVNIPANPYSGETPDLYFKYVSITQTLYNIGLLPGFFLGIFIIFFQFFLPPITYGILGLVAGCIYGKIRTKHSMSVNTN